MTGRNGYIESDECSNVFTKEMENSMSGLSINKLVTVVFLSLSIVASLQAFAQDKPLLSDAIRKAIDSQGVEAAKKHFAELDESQGDSYNIDMQGISELTNAYVQAGNMEAAGAVSEISAPFLQGMIIKSLNQYAPELSKQVAEQQAEKEQQAKDSEEERKSQEQEQIVNFQGEPRKDLERFVGLYGDPAETNPNRKLWVTVSCDGYLVVGALWGDASPWWMRSAGDNVFTYQDSFSKLRIKFETGANGKAVRMIHDLEHMKSPMELLGPLPADWDPCVERPKR
jgi:hypothetical protein